MSALPSAHELFDTIEAQSDAIEAARRLPNELAQTFAKAGFFGMLVPKRYGGLEVAPQTFFDTLALIARADGSAAWNAMIGSTTGLLSASLPDEWAEALYGSNPEVITVGVTAPIGIATPLAAGGLEVNGRWPFGSGCENAHWIAGGVTVKDADGQTLKNRFGAPETRLVFFPADAVEIHDTWDTSGLRGTGSHDFEVHNAVVPEGRWATLGNRPRVDGTLYRFPTLGLLALGVSAVSIGIAEKALAAFKDLASSKTPTGASRTLANRTSAQRDVAKAEAAILSARALTREAIEESQELAERGESLPLEHKARLRLAAANNAWTAAGAVDTLYHAAGGTAIYRKSPLQKCFRDVHVTTQHIMVGQPIFDAVGKVSLGIDPKQPL